ncbi:hypothetical protein CICLE_v10023616mg [Citrus x clementina]|uniref:Uncharacterized protein n=1 Tax=Citrus clementina TaxID=85681 RepID=V4U5M1_CITCL|nr:hypothetical protein CICLE_v10023616mg [Citrus x clementina]
MKCLLDRFGYSAADLDAPFLHDCTPNKPFVRFTQIEAALVTSKALIKCVRIDSIYKRVELSGIDSPHFL